MIRDSEFIRIGVISGAHALNGRLKIYITSDILDRFSKGNTVYLYVQGVYKEYTISGFSLTKGKTGLLHLREVKNRNEAESLRKVEIFIEKSSAEQSREKYLDDDTFYYYDLLESKVYYENKMYGTVKDVIEAGSGEILVVENEEGKEIMIPFVKEMVDVNRLQEKRIDINPVEGLLDI